MTLPILITGHTGFVGRAVTAAMDKQEIPWLGASRGTGYDLEVAGSLANAPEARWIIHLAARVGVVPSWSNPEAFYRTNILSTLTALEYARRTKARMLYLSSYMYGIPKYQPIDEKHPTAGLNPYAQSKHMSEALCATYAENFSVPCVVLRPFSVYGTGQTLDQLVPYLVDQAVKGDQVKLADEKPVRDFLWVGDLAEAMLTILEKDPHGLSVYNIGTGEGVSVGDVVKAVLAQTGPREVICQDKERRNEIPVCIADASALRRDFGWKPKTSLAEGIRQMIEAYHAG